MKQKVFTDTKGLELVITHRASAIVFATQPADTGKKDSFAFHFDDHTFKEFRYYLHHIANEAWKNLIVKEANSMGSDYYEYYDRALDNNGYLSISDKTIKLTKPMSDTDKLYQFNKAKIQSFLYDLDKVAV